MLSFRNRLLILLIGLVAGAQIVTLFTALARTAAEERRRADVQLMCEPVVQRGRVGYKCLSIRTLEATGVITEATA